MTKGPATATIASGAPLSGAIDLARQRLHRIVIPAGWTTAAISFQASGDGVTYFDLCDGAGKIMLAATVPSDGRVLVVDANPFLGIRYLNLRSGTAAAPVAQAAARTILLATVAR